MALKTNTVALKIDSKKLKGPVERLKDGGNVFTSGGIR